MAKQVRSIRLDDCLLSTFTDYSNLLHEMFGYTLSLSTIVNEAMAEFMLHSAEHWVSAMESGSIVDPLPNGKMKRYEFNDDQIERMKKIVNDAGAVFYSMQEK